MSELKNLSQLELRHELNEAVTAALIGTRTKVRGDRCAGKLFARLHGLIDGRKVGAVRDVAPMMD